MNRIYLLRLLSALLLCSAGVPVLVSAQVVRQSTPLGRGNIPSADTSAMSQPNRGFGTDNGTADGSATGTDDEEQGEPRLLETSLFHDTLKRQRIFVWQHSRYLNTLHIIPLDTLIGDRFRDYPFLQRDVGANYLGTVGSAVVLHDYFKRQTNPLFYYLSPYLEYAITPENIRFYNTKKAYTRFEYSGTLFANSALEEGNVDMFVTANALPQWNWNVRYRHFGTRGQLENEATDNSEFTFATSYSGKRYNAHGGFIYNGWSNKENGGITDDSFILDTIVDARGINVSLPSAASKINMYTFFVTQSYSIPLRLFRKDTTQHGAAGDSTQLAAAADSVWRDDGTVVYFGHAAEYTTLARSYSDRIEPTDSAGRSYYRDRFYIHPTSARDSMRMRLFDNRLFLSLQPWAADAIVSKITGGIGYANVSNYAFRPTSYLTPSDNDIQHNLYVYGAASGLFRRFFRWSALARYDMAGYSQHDFSIDGQVRVSVYPAFLKRGLHLTGTLLLQAKRPDYFLNHTYTNHFYWENDFDKTVETRIGIQLDIPDWDMEAAFNYALLSGAVYFNTDAYPVQHNSEISLFAGSLKKNFKLWQLHFDHRLLVQYSTAAAFPVPLLSANFTYYLQGSVVKNVLTAQLGVDAYFNTLYYAYAYNPGAGAFHLQRIHEIGEYPYLDAFLNMKWKHAVIFAKLTNVAQGWPNSNYFSALHYIRPQTVLKLGISWFFN
ncbi:MAG: putative porin [Prevotellaceae bacterium]|jgi:hypothetical protein|nr:putative porin [Prevotellaceae bacterium]